MHKTIKQHNFFQLSEIFIEQQIRMRMISEGSCDSECRSVDAENSVLPSQEKLENNYFSNDSQHYCF